MKIEKRKDFLINLFYVIAVCLLLFVGIRFGLAWCFPFVLGFFIAMILQNPIHYLNSKIQISNRIVAIIVLLFFYVVIGSLFTVLIVKVLSMIGDVIRDFPVFFKTTVTPALEVLSDELTELFARINPDGALEFEVLNEQLISVVMNAVPTISSSSLNAVTSVISSVPSFLISFLFTIISSFFFAVDYRKIVNFILLQFNENQRKVILGIKNHGLGTITKFIKSYGIIMLITFTELSIGLTIIGVENAISLALLIAIFDILPVLGTGGIMIPWFLISLLNGEITLAIQLIAIYAIITVIRNIIEPKIVGDQVGAHPILMLLCMYVGVKLLGALGIFILPMTLIIVKNLNDEGVIHIFKTSEQETNIENID